MKIKSNELKQILRTIIKEETQALKTENLSPPTGLNAKLKGIVAGLGARLKTDRNNAQIQNLSTQLRTQGNAVNNQLYKLFGTSINFRSAMIAKNDVYPDSVYKQQLEEFVALTTQQITAIQNFISTSNQFYQAIEILQQNANAQGVQQKAAIKQGTTTTTPAQGTTTTPPAQPK